MRYWLAMNASAVQSAAHAGRAWLAVAGAHAASDSIPALNLQQFGSVLLLTFGMAILDWLDKNPIPVINDTTVAPQKTIS